MPTPFKPPARDALATADRAQGVSYAAQCVVVEGVVSGAGQGGWYGPNEGFDIHCFAFAGWRHLNKALVVRNLSLLRPVPPYMCHSLPNDGGIFEEFPAYSIQRLSVLLSTDQTRAVVERALKIDEPDESLVLLAQRLREPVVISTKQFGELTLNPTIGRFEGIADWGRETIDISIERDANGCIDTALETAEQLWADQATWKQKVDNFAVTELLPLKNESWLGDGEAELTAKEFAARMVLDSITIDRNCRFEFWHDDGDLFWGHWIQVCGNFKDGLTNADIPG